MKYSPKIKSVKLAQTDFEVENKKYLDKYLYTPARHENDQKEENEEKKEEKREEKKDRKKEEKKEVLASYRTGNVFEERSL